MIRVATLTMQVESSITITPAEPSIEPAAASESKSIPTSQPALRDQRRRDPAGDHRLDLAPRWRPAGTVLDQFAQRYAHRQLVKARFPHLAAEAIELRAGALVRADAAEPVGPRATICGTQASVSTLLITVGLA